VDELEVRESGSKVGAIEESRNDPAIERVFAPTVETSDNA
jgi:hypothetical protein